MNNKALSLISAFSDAEIEDLKEFIIYNHSTKAKLYCRLITIFRSLPSLQSNVDKVQLFQQLFGEEKYKGTKLRLLQSDVVQAIEQFIAFKALERDRPFFKKAILKFQQLHNLSSLYTKTLARYTREIRSQEMLGHEQFQQELYIAERQYDLAMQQRKLGIKEAQDLHERLDYNFIVQKLRYSCLSVSQEHVFNMSIDYGIRNAILDYIEANALYNDPAIGLYYFCYQMLSKKKHFDDFQECLGKYGSRFSEEERKELYTLAINFCIRNLNQGDKKYGHLGLTFYQEGIQEGILLSQGRITKFTFRNMITMAIRIGEFDLAQSFIEKYESFLERKDKDNMVTFTSALVLFAQGNFNEASQELVHIDFKDLLFNLASKSLQLKIYYEMEEFWVLRSHLDAMQIFLKRHSSLGYHKNNYLSMISYTRKLMNANSLEKVNNLKLKLEEEDNVFERKWLEEKLQQKKNLALT